MPPGPNASIASLLLSSRLSTQSEQEPISWTISGLGRVAGSERRLGYRGRPFVFDGRAIADARVQAERVGEGFDVGEACHARLGGREKPVVSAWTEPRASAAHAVAVVGWEASLQQGFDKTGLPHLRVTEWLSGDTKRREPACGAVLKPYRPVELGYITAIASGFALDLLLGAVHTATNRVWACSRRFFDGTGGAWSPEWRSVPGFRDEGGFVRDLTWPSVVAQRGEVA